MGKSKRLSISKTADRRAKRTKIWDSGYYNARLEDTFDARFLEFGLGSFSAKCPILQFSKLCSSLNFHPISSKLYILI